MAFHRVNEEALRTEAAHAKQRQAKRGRGDWRFYNKFRPGYTYFFLLPPWAPTAGVPGRHVWKHFSMPDESNKVITCWKTYDVYQPGMGDQCPICEAVHAISTANADAARNMRANASVAINACILGYRSAQNAPFELFMGTSEEEHAQAHLPFIMELRASIWDAIMAYLMTSRDRLVPEQATTLLVHRSGTGKNDTRYAVTAMGQNTVTGGFERSVENMWTAILQTRQNYLQMSPDDLAAAVEKNMADLDAVWPLPGDEEKVVVTQVANRIRTHHSRSGGVVYAAPTPGVPAPAPVPHAPMAVAGAYGAPTFPQVATPNASAAPAPVPHAPGPPLPAAAALPSAPPAGPRSHSVPAPPPPIAAAPIAAAPAATATAVAIAPPPGPKEDPETATSPTEARSSASATREALLQQALTQPSGVEALRWAEDEQPHPVCFMRYHGMQKSPNAAWCVACVFRHPCMAMSAAEE
jgi:hypothetical protein